MLDNKSLLKVYIKKILTLSLMVALGSYEMDTLAIFKDQSL